MGFYIYLPSNTKGSNNTPASFTIQLPKKLEFHSTWLVGCTGIMYTNSWVTMGTEKNQSITIEWADGRITKLMLPKTTYKTKEDLLSGLKKLLEKANNSMCSVNKRSRRNAIPPSEMFIVENQINSSKNSKEMRILIDKWIVLMEKNISFMKLQRTKAKSSGIDTTAREQYDLREENRLREIQKDMESKFSKLQLQEEDEEAEQDYQRMLNEESRPTVSIAQSLPKPVEPSATVPALPSPQPVVPVAKSSVPVLPTPQSTIPAPKAVISVPKASDPKPSVPVLPLPKAVIPIPKPSDPKPNVPVLPALPESVIPVPRTTVVVSKPKAISEVVFSKPTFVPATINLEKDPNKKVYETQGVKEYVKPILPLTNFTVPVRETQALAIDTEEEACNKITDEMFNHLHEYVVLTFDDVLERFVLKINKDFVKNVKFSEQLQYILGFSEELLENSLQSAKYAYDLMGGVHTLYIYAPNLVEHTMVGDKSSPLLRIAKVKGKPGEIVEDIFLSPQYYKVLEKQITEIKIEIYSSTGRLIPFSYGETILTLHFKKLSLF